MSNSSSDSKANSQRNSISLSDNSSSSNTSANQNQKRYVGARSKMNANTTHSNSSSFDSTGKNAANNSNNPASRYFLSNTPRFDPNKTQLHKDELHFFNKQVKQQNNNNSNNNNSNNNNNNKNNVNAPTWWHHDDDAGENEPKRLPVKQYSVPENLANKAENNHPKKARPINSSNQPPYAIYDQPNQIKNETGDGSIKRESKYEQIKNMDNRSLRRSATTMHKVMGHQYQRERPLNFDEWNSTQNPNTYKYKSQVNTSRVIN